MACTLEIKKEIGDEIDECELVFVREAIEATEPRRKSKTNYIEDLSSINDKSTTSVHSNGDKVNSDDGKGKHEQCKICLKMFENKNRRNAHVYLTHSTKYGKHECEICKERFLSRAYLVAHKTTHLKRERPFECGYCKRRFVQMRHLQNHESIMHKNESIECKFCEKKYTNSFDYIAHMRTEHFSLLRKEDKETGTLNEVFQGIRTFECFKCGHFSDNYNNLRNHIGRCQNNSDEVHCTKCSQIFKSMLNLQKHMHYTHSSKYKKFECETCKKMFPTWSGLYKHKRGHLEKTSFKCGFCKRRFVQMGHLRNHERANHRKESIACKFCDKKCTSSFEIIAHMRSEHFSLLRKEDIGTGTLHAVFQGIRTFECFKCGHFSNNYNNLRNHMTQCQNNNLYCTKCSKLFKNSQSMAKHLYLYHSQEKPVNCYFCEKTFVHKVLLKTHEHIAHKNKSISCKFCDKKFSNSYKIVAHMQRMHFDLMRTKDKKVTKCEADRFKCDICAKIFSSKRNIREHMSIHKMVESESEEKSEERNKIEDQQPKIIEVIDEISSISILDEDEEMQVQDSNTEFEHSRIFSFENEQCKCDQCAKNSCKSIKCTKCRFTCTSYITLRQHMRKRHLEDIIFLSDDDEDESDEGMNTECNYIENQRKGINNKQMETECIYISDSEADEDEVDKWDVDI